MAKKNEVPETEVVTALTLPKVFNKRAYSIRQKDGQFDLICVSYNDELEVGSATVMETTNDEFDIRYSLEQAVENLIYD